MAEEFKISEWLQSVKEEPKKAAPIFVILGAIAFIDWKFFYSPKAVQIDKELKKNKRIVGEMKNFKNAANQLEDIKIDIENKKKKWEDTKKLCYKESERTIFLKKVREAAAISGMSIRNITPLHDEPVQLGVVDAKKFSVQFAYNGDLTKLLTFMRLMEVASQTIFMPIPSLKPNASGTFDTTLTVSTIIFPDLISTNAPEPQANEEEEEEEE